jgi:hypothetical protein
LRVCLALVVALVALLCLRPRWVDPCPGVDLTPRARPLSLAAVPPGSGSALLLQALDLVGKLPADLHRQPREALDKLRRMPLGPAPVPDPPGYGTPPAPRLQVVGTHGKGPGMGAGDDPEARPLQPAYTPFDATHSWTVSEVRTVEDLLERSRPALDLAAQATRAPGEEGFDFGPGVSRAEYERVFPPSNVLRDLLLLRAGYAWARGDLANAAADIASLLDLAQVYQRGCGAAGWEAWSMLWSHGATLAVVCSDAAHRLAPLAPDAVLAQMVADSARAEARLVPVADVVRVQAERLEQLRQQDPAGFWGEVFPGLPLPRAIELQPRWGWLVGSDNATVARDLHRFNAQMVRLAEEPYDAEAQQRFFERLKPRRALLLHQDPLGYVVVAALCRTHWEQLGTGAASAESAAWAQASYMLHQAGTLTLLRSLRTSLAVRRYILRQGHPPGALADLVPEFLATVPVDPFTLKPLQYELDTAGHWRVFSLGQDKSLGGDDDVGWGSDWSATRYGPPCLRDRL